MIPVTLYTRQGCHLCEQVQAELAALQTDIPHLLTVIDIDEQPKWKKKYGQLIPVVTVGPYVLKTTISAQDLRITLGAVQLTAEQDEKITRDLREGRLVNNIAWTRADRATYWISRHYLALFNLLVIVYLGLAFLAPILMKIGVTRPADLIYKAYSLTCHQLPYRSWFLFGQQPFYPVEAAKISGWVTYEEAFHGDPLDLFVARAAVGDGYLGYKVALCQRDVAIYGSIILFGLAFIYLRKRYPALRGVRWYVWLLLGVIPMGLDGGTQLVSQIFPQFNHLIPFRESTPLLRTITGALFGLFTAWFGYPIVEESMVETRRYMDLRKPRSSAP